MRYARPFVRRTRAMQSPRAPLILNLRGTKRSYCPPLSRNWVKTYSATSCWIRRGRSFLPLTIRASPIAIWTALDCLSMTNSKCGSWDGRTAMSEVRSLTERSTAPSFLCIWQFRWGLGERLNLRSGTSHRQSWLQQRWQHRRLLSRLG